jgi:hypothetical protein
MKTVVSASRRTDMPACHLDSLAGFVRQGCAEVTNPYSSRTSRVDLDPDTVHTLVLWSKDFGPFLRRSAEFDRYRPYFLFTVNDMPHLELSLPPLTRRIDQARELAERYGPERIGWRFDPVIFDRNGPVTPVESYVRIGSAMRDRGIRRSIFSFLDLYGKVKTRIARFSLGIVDPPDEVKRAYAETLAAAARSLGMRLESCSETIGGVEGIERSACIDGALLSLLAGEPAPTAKDSGQRPSCRCTVSRDIGSYDSMPCPHGCLYCYANPVIGNGGGDRP